MTADDIRNAIVDSLTRVAPEIDPSSLQPGTRFRDELDLDSMDFLSFVLGLHDRLGVDIPESDYPRLYTFDSALSYLAAKAGVRLPAAGDRGGDAARS